MNDIEHPDINRIERTGYPSRDYLEHEMEEETENTHPSRQEE